jgi:hypothetical protein
MRRAAGPRPRTSTAAPPRGTPRTFVGLREDLAERVEHLLLALADELGVETQEAALLRRLRRVLRSDPQPVDELLALLRCELLVEQRGDRAQLREDLVARVPALGPEPGQRVLAAATSRATDWTKSPCVPFSASSITVRIAAVDSFSASIGPPGSASEIALPATSGDRPSRVHSSSVKSSRVVMCHTSYVS